MQVQYKTVVKLDNRGLAGKAIKYNSHVAFGFKYYNVLLYNTIHQV